VQARKKMLNNDDDDHHHHQCLTSIHHVSLKQAKMDFHASMARPIYSKLSSPSPKRNQDVNQQGNQQY